MLDGVGVCLPRREWWTWRGAECSTRSRGTKVEAKVKVAAWNYVEDTPTVGGESKRMAQSPTRRVSTSGLVVERWTRLLALRAKGTLVVW